MFYGVFSGFPYARLCKNIIEHRVPRHEILTCEVRGSRVYLLKHLHITTVLRYPSKTSMDMIALLIGIHIWLDQNQRTITSPIIIYNAQLMQHIMRCTCACVVPALKRRNCIASILTGHHYSAKSQCTSAPACGDAFPLSTASWPVCCISRRSSWGS